MQELNRGGRQTKRGLRGLTANIGQRHQKACQQNTDRMQAPEKGYDDRGKAIARVEIDADLTGRPSHLEKPRNAGQGARDAQAEHGQPRWVNACETRSPRALTCQTNLEAKNVSRQQNIGKDHSNQCRHAAPMQSRAFPDETVMSGREISEIPTARKAHAVRVAQQPRRD